MSKIKISHKNNQIIAKTKLGRTEQVNQQEVAIFTTKWIRGLMRPVIVGDKKINYTAPNGILLEKYLKRGINKHDFFMVIAQINEMLKKMERYKLNLNNLLIDFKYIFINERTKEVNFIYQPIMGTINNFNIFNFVYEMMSCAVFQSNEDMQGIHELTNFLNRMQFFSTVEFEKCILQVYPEIYKQVHRESFVQSTELKESVATDVEEETGRMDATDEDDIKTGLLIKEDEEECETTALNMPCKETTVLQQKINPYLIRKRTSEKVCISKGVFKIGRDKSKVDYVIENSTVSGMHANIMIKDDTVFVRDESRNGTYIDGIEIPKNEEIEIMNGCELRFADEEFEFYRE